MLKEKPFLLILPLFHYKTLCLTDQLAQLELLAGAFVWLLQIHPPTPEPEPLHGDE